MTTQVLILNKGPRHVVVATPDEAARGAALVLAPGAFVERYVSKGTEYGIVEVSDDPVPPVVATGG